MHHWLLSLWEDSQSHFGLLSVIEQGHLHDYFVPTWSSISDEDLLRYRKKIGTDLPSLPAAAGRAASKLRQQMEALPLTPTPVPPIGKRRVTVRAVAKPKIDEDAMAKALLRAAEDLKETRSDQRAA